MVGVLEQMASMVTALVLLTTMAAGAASIVARPTRLLAAMRPPLVFGPAIALTGCVLATFVVMFGNLIGETPGWAVQRVLIMGLMIMGFAALLILPRVGELEAAHPRTSPDRWLWVLMLAALSWSLLWMGLVNWTDSIQVDESFFLRDVGPSRPVELVAVGILVLLIAGVEEIVYRGWIQRALMDRLGSPWVAIFIASLLWAIAHGGYVQPYGVKELHILVLGLMIGFACHRYGLLGAILIHGANNAMGVGIPFVTGD